MSIFYTVSTLSVRGGLWVAPVHTLHMPKPVITFVFKVLRNGVLRYILYTCPNNERIVAVKMRKKTSCEITHAGSVHFFCKLHMKVMTT